MRPWYETPQKLVNEQQIIKAYAIHRHCTPMKSKRGQCYDYALTRDDEQIIAFAEVKRRHVPVDKYDTIMLSLGKWLELRKLGELTGRPVVFVVGFDDALAERVLSDRDAEDIRWGGRTLNTRDAADIEPVIHIPTTLFNILART